MFWGEVCPLDKISLLKASEVVRYANSEVKLAFYASLVKALFKTVLRIKNSHKFYEVKTSLGYKPNFTLKENFT